eukprot:g15229.t1
MRCRAEPRPGVGRCTASSSKVLVQPLNAAAGCLGRRLSLARWWPLGEPVQPRKTKDGRKGYRECQIFCSDQKIENQARPGPTTSLHPWRCHSFVINTKLLGRNACPAGRRDTALQRKSKVTQCPAVGSCRELIASLSQPIEDSQRVALEADGVARVPRLALAAAPHGSVVLDHRVNHAPGLEDSAQAGQDLELAAPRVELEYQAGIRWHQTRAVDQVDLDSRVVDAGEIAEGGVLLAHGVRPGPEAAVAHAHALPAFCPENPHGLDVRFVLGRAPSYEPRFSELGYARWLFWQVQALDPAAQRALAGEMHVCTLRLPLRPGASGRYALTGFLASLGASEAYVVVAGNTTVAAGYAAALSLRRRRRALADALADTGAAPVGPFAAAGDTDGDGLVSLSDTSHIAAAAAQFAATATPGRWLVDGEIPVGCTGCGPAGGAPPEFRYDRGPPDPGFRPLLQAFTPSLHHMNPYEGTPLHEQWPPDPSALLAAASPPGGRPTAPGTTRATRWTWSSTRRAWVAPVVKAAGKSSPVTKDIVPLGAFLWETEVLGYTSCSSSSAASSSGATPARAASLAQSPLPSSPITSAPSSSSASALPSTSPRSADKGDPVLNRSRSTHSILSPEPPSPSPTILSSTSAATQALPPAPPETLQWTLTHEQRNDQEEEVEVVEQNEDEEQEDKDDPEWTDDNELSSGSSTRTKKSGQPSKKKQRTGKNKKSSKSKKQQTSSARAINVFGVASG